MVTLRLPSSEMRMVRAECRATVGTLSNAEHQNVKVGKAGRNRHKGKRPQTRGIAMNPVDHPHGGGEAHKTPGRPPGDAVGQADARLPDAQEGQALRRDDRPRPPARQEEDGRQLDEQIYEEGPVRRGAPDEAHHAMNEAEPEADGQDLVAHLDGLPGDGRAHDRRPRRPQARARVRLRVDGRPQARRVRARPAPSAATRGAKKALSER